MQNQLKTSCGVVFESLGLHRKNPYWLYWRCSSQGYTIQLHIDMCHAQAQFALLKKVAPRKHLKQHVLVSLGFDLAGYMVGSINFQQTSFQISVFWLDGGCKGLEKYSENLALC